MVWNVRELDEEEDIDSTDVMEPNCQRKTPWFGWLGLAIMILSEIALWSHFHLVAIGFTPALWTGYIMIAVGSGHVAERPVIPVGLCDDLSSPVWIV